MRCGRHAVRCGRHAIRCGQHAVRCGRYAVRCGRHAVRFTSFLANFEKFSKCFQLFQGQKYIFFKKCSKNGLVSKKIENIFITFKGGGVRPQSDKNHFFLSLPLQSSGVVGTIHIVYENPRLLLSYDGHIDTRLYPSVVND